jgi:hypothetical protein
MEIVPSRPLKLFYCYADEDAVFFLGEMCAGIYSKS